VANLKNYNGRYVDSAELRAKTRDKVDFITFLLEIDNMTTGLTGDT
jgi:hypothetical protein